jgi:hypothetical protein
MNFRPGNRDEPEINLIPFIDILLVVLIFLMLTTTYSKFTELQVNLPVADAQAQRENPKEVIVAISSDGRYSINKEVLEGSGVDTLTRALAKPRMTARWWSSSAPTQQPPTSRSSTSWMRRGAPVWCRSPLPPSSRWQGASDQALSAAPPGMATPPEGSAGRQARWQASAQRRGLQAWLLRPIAWVYGWLMAIRSRFYAWGLLTSQRLPVPVIVVGNVVVGGAGKTPTVIALVQHLTARGWHPGVVSRGYGRSSEALLEVTAATPASESGDEPALIRRATGVPVFVARQRAAAARALLAAHPHVNVLLCDDGLQHLALHRDMAIAVFDERGSGNGWLLPQDCCASPGLPHPVRPTGLMWCCFSTAKAQHRPTSHWCRASRSLPPFAAWHTTRWGFADNASRWSNCKASHHRGGGHCATLGVF